MILDITRPEIGAALALVDARLATEREDRKIPGLSAGVVYDQDLIWHKGYGNANRDKLIPANENTIYRVASITKLFTATMLMQLRDAGKVSLDDPIEKHLPEFKIKSEFSDARPATFRQVASHGSGLPREGAHQGWRSTTMPAIEDLLADLAQLDMRLPVMTEPKYSNLGIAIMGHALSRVAGQRYDDYVRENILQPLGMTQSGFDPSVYGDERAIGYHLAKGKFEISPVWDEKGFRPAGGLYSSVSDIARFISLQFRDGPSGGKQILGGSSLREMQNPVLVSQDFEVGFGIGWGIRRVAGKKVIGHSGGLPGYTTNITLVPSMKLAVIVFTNTGTAPVEISNGLLELLIPIFSREAARQQPQPSAEEIAALAPYTGRYHWLDDDEIELKVVKGRLKLIDPDLPGMQVALIPVGKGRFRIEGGPHTADYAVFDADADGKITGVMLAGYPLARILD
jgi:CubicO group peptidase (beta-lactamase class C family)